MGTEGFVFAREFPLHRSGMYALWTNVESLQKWFGPAGVRIPRSSLDLRPGGRYHFCMHTPDGGEMWGLWVFTAVEPGRRLEWRHSFSDRDGGITRHPMGADWPLVLLSSVTFDDVPGVPAATRVAVRWTPHEATDAERAAFAAGYDSMQKGWAGTFDQLARYIASMS
jgi:uncharacterized protein YndB with AHSA1/START domain